MFFLPRDSAWSNLFPDTVHVYDFNSELPNSSMYTVIIKHTRVTFTNILEKCKSML